MAFTLSLTVPQDILRYQRGIRHLVFARYRIIFAKCHDGSFSLVATSEKTPYPAIEMHACESLLWLPMSKDERSVFYRRSGANDNTATDFFGHPLDVKIHIPSIRYGTLAVAFTELGGITLPAEELINRFDEVLQLPTASSLLSEHLRLRRRTLPALGASPIRTKAHLRLVIS